MAVLETATLPRLTQFQTTGNFYICFQSDGSVLIMRPDRQGDVHGMSTDDTTFDVVIRETQEPGTGDYGDDKKKLKRCYIDIVPSTGMIRSKVRH